jgi:phage gp37-like protein
MIDLVEDAIIARIQAAAAATPGLGYKIPVVESYGGELDGGPDELATVIRKFPAVWVTFAGCRASTKMTTSGGKWKTPATFVTMCGSRNVRGERATRHGLTVGGVIKEVGAYQMIKDVSFLLAGNDLGLGITRLKPGAIRTLFNTRLKGQGLAVYAREWHCELIETQPREQIDPTSGDFLKVGISYYLQPDDGNADSSGVVQLT